jgi:coenzyme F420-0:L-glutamate ligase/coenzyme F420-1:gamma-L-glutamate ligase
VLLLPENPDRSCAQLRAALEAHTGARIGVIMNDSHGRAFRNGVVGVTIGASGVAALADLRGQADLFGRTLRATEVAVADELAGAASLLMGQAAEGRPIVLARGFPLQAREASASDLYRPRHMDVFR